MTTNTPDQQVTMPTDPDIADNPVAFVDAVADMEPRLVRSYVDAGDRTARMLSLSENAVSTLAAENRAEIFDGTNHISLYTRSLYAEVLRSSDSAALVSNTTLQNDTQLFVALPAAGSFSYELWLFYDSSTTADFKAALTFPAGTVLRYGGIGPSTAIASGVGTGSWLNASASGTALIFGGNGVGSVVTMVMRGFCNMGGTAGNLQLQWAQNTSDATNTIVRTGSSLSVWRRA